MKNWMYLGISAAIIVSGCSTDTEEKTFQEQPADETESIETETLEEENTEKVKRK